jgi:acyl-CoA synthetase (AMP-forming)/AMP-acid ligase II
MEFLKKVAGYGSVAIGLLPGGKYNISTQPVGHGGNPVKTFKNLPRTLDTLYDELFKGHGDKPWIVFEGKRITFADARAIYEAVARELVHGMAMKPGDKVGIAMRNFPEFCLSFIAIQAMGGVAVPLNSLWGTDEME